MAGSRHVTYGVEVLCVLTDNRWYTFMIEYLHLQMISLYDINNEIDVQFCMNTFDHVV